MGADADHPRPRGGRRPRRPARDHAPRPGGRGGADGRGAARDAPPLHPRALRRLGAPAATRLPRLARAPLLEVEGMVRDYPGRAARAVRAAGGVPRGARRQLHAARRARASGSSARSGCGKSTLTRADPRARGDAGRQRPDRGRGGAGRRADAARACAPRCRWCSRTPTAASTRATGSRGWSPSRSTCSTTRRAGRRGGAAVAAALEEVGLGAGRRGEVHPRVLRRPAPAHRHRPGADHPAEADHPRRGGLGARRAGPGADPRPARRPHGAATGSPTSSSATT